MLGNWKGKKGFPKVEEKKRLVRNAGMSQLSVATEEIVGFGLCSNKRVSASPNVEHRYEYWKQSSDQRN